MQHGNGCWRATNSFGEYEYGIGRQDNVARVRRKFHVAKYLRARWCRSNITAAQSIKFCVELPECGGAFVGLDSFVRAIQELIRPR